MSAEAVLEAPSPGATARQATLLFSSFGAAQAASFLRNAVLGHALSKTDFGIAATIALLLQLVEMITDLGADRLIVQAEHGASPRFVAASHAVLAARGVLVALVILITGPWVAAFFAIPGAEGGFALIALVPLIKGFTHLDWRRAQRDFNNTPQAIIEVVPQLTALLAVPLMLAAAPGYMAVVWLFFLQAALGVAISHILAKERYRFAFDRLAFKEQWAFGLPVLLSAFPLIAVFQGDRAIIGHLKGVETLAGYSAAFMLTMVPGVVAAKAAQAILLPLFSQAVRLKHPLHRPYGAAIEATTVFAAALFALFAVAGDEIVALVFGKNYTGLGAIATALACMWSVRTLQAVPGMALMAYGTTKPFFTAGMIRAAALPVVYLLALHGYGLATIAYTGAAFEFFSLLFVVYNAERFERGLGFILATRSAFFFPAAAVTLTVAYLIPPASVPGALALAGALTIAVLMSAIALLPALRAYVRATLAAFKLIEAV